MVELVSRSARAGALAVAIGLFALAGGRARAADDDSSAVDQIVAVLKQKGLIDEATGNEILAKQAKAEAKASAEKTTPSVAQGLLEGLIWSGDLRLRDEQFWYAKGLQGASANDNNRIRYRARFGFTKQVNSWAQVGVRLASDTTDYRSTNVTVGQNSNFSFDSIYMDLAYAKFELPDPGFDVKTSIVAGKFANPFMWKKTLDKIMWDDDINPEGIAITPTWQPTESTTIWANFGYFVELQQSSQVDPRVWAYQLNGSQKFAEAFEVGARVTYYDWENLQNDPNFFTGSFANGNQPIAFKHGGARFLESSGYLTWSGIPDWPALLWGTWVANLDAHGGVVNGVSVSAQNNAWGLGFEIGDAKKWARFGVAYNSVEANGVLGLYTDSDMFDGLTNRRGYAFYGARQVADNTELKISLWESDPIKTTESGAGGGPYNISTSTDSQSNRSRLQVDLSFKY